MPKAAQGKRPRRLYLFESGQIVPGSPASFSARRQEVPRGNPCAKLSADRGRIARRRK